MLLDFIIFEISRFTLRPYLIFFFLEIVQNVIFDFWCWTNDFRWSFVPATAQHSWWWHYGYVFKINNKKHMLYSNFYKYMTVWFIVSGNCVEWFSQNGYSIEKTRLIVHDLMISVIFAFLRLRQQYLMLVGG